MNIVEENLIKDKIKGARNFTNIFLSFILMIAGIGFSLAGISSYFNKNLLVIADVNKITFFPQGILMLFYGTIAFTVSIYLFITIIYNVGSGYNEYSKIDETINIVRLGFPGKNRKIFLSYKLKNIKMLKYIIKESLNPRSTILLILKDKREIPLYPAQNFLNPNKLEKKALQISTFLNIPLENGLI